MVLDRVLPLWVVFLERGLSVELGLEGVVESSSRDPEGVVRVLDRDLGCLLLQVVSLEGDFVYR